MIFAFGQPNRRQGTEFCVGQAAIVRTPRNFDLKTVIQQPSQMRRENARENELFELFLARHRSPPSRAV